MRKVLVIGVGGIGSFFIREIYNLIENGVNGTEDLSITMMDNDLVEEKNLRYQHFDIDDLEIPKAKALAEKYIFEYYVNEVKKEEQLKNYDIIMLCVDNGKTRNLVYKYCEKNNKYFIDLRSEGRGIAYYTKHKNNTLELLKSTIDVNKPSTSCQLKFELDKGKIQIGNRIIAMIGVQLLLNHLRGENNPAKFIQRF
jgi:molybdopterin/thiamine biosynthesis adenylyltransferase